MKRRGEREKTTEEDKNWIRSTVVTHFEEKKRRMELSTSGSGAFLVQRR